MNTKSKQQEMSELVPGFMSGRITTGDMIKEHLRRKEIDESFEKTNSPVTVRLDQVLITQIDEYSKRLGLKRSEFLKMIISSGVYEAGMQLAVNGMLDDVLKEAPEWLSAPIQDKVHEEWRKEQW